MSLISEEYRKLNEQLHENPEYGSRNAPRWVKVIKDLTWEFETFSVLDYGCGKGNLAKMMTNMPVKNYDPAVPEFSAIPTPGGYRDLHRRDGTHRTRVPGRRDR